MNNQSMPAVLIVEDSAGMRLFIRSALANRFPGWIFLEAETGFEALKRLPETNIQLIITDINMPDINGLEFISFVREHPLYCRIPIIIVSTESSPDDRQRGLQLGANAYLVKPFEPGELIETVRNVLNLSD